MFASVLIALPWLALYSVQLQPQLLFSLEPVRKRLLDLGVRVAGSAIMDPRSVVQDSPASFIIFGNPSACQWLLQPRLQAAQLQRALPLPNPVGGKFADEIVAPRPYDAP